MEQKRPADIFQELLDYLWDALIQPPGGVLDINMEKYASGGH